MSKRTFNFGKKDFYGCGRKINAMEVELEIRDHSKGPELSICGSVWNNKHTDIVAGGQCLDEMNKFLGHHKVFQELYHLWKNYHLNTMHAGTPKQEKLIADAEKDGRFEALKNELSKDKGKYYFGPDHYDVTVELLKRNNLLTDKLEDGTDYQYGTSWLYSK